MNSGDCAVYNNGSITNEETKKCCKPPELEPDQSDQLEPSQGPGVETSRLLMIRFRFRGLKYDYEMFFVST